MNESGRHSIQVDPKAIRSSITTNFRSPIFIAPIAAVSACSLLLIADPATGVYPPCPSQAFMGVDCPACGGLRATSALLHGDVMSFLDHNVLLVVVFPLLIALWIFALWQKINSQLGLSLSRSAWRNLWVGSALVLGLFTVARNIFPYLGSGIG